MDFKEELARKAGRTTKDAEVRAFDTKPEENAAGNERKPFGAEASGTAQTVRENGDREAGGNRKENAMEESKKESSEKGVPGIRLLKPTEIECRIGSIKENGLSLLLYKDARVDQRILDETFGIFGWQRSHQMIDGNLYCTVSVYDEKTGGWISKQDVGIAGYAEKEKSQASDSFKRACVNIGIGRELYSAPFIWIPAGKAEIVQGREKDKFYCNDRFRVHSITYNEEREIVALMIVNQRREVVFNNAQPGMREKAGTANPPADTGRTGNAMGKTGAQRRKLPAYKLQELAKELDRTGVEIERIQARYPFKNVEEMSDETYRRVMIDLSATPDKAA